MKVKIGKVSAVLLFLGAALPGAARAAKTGSEDISNMLIEGENRLRVEPLVPTLEWNVDLYKGVMELLRDNTLVADIRPPTLVRPPIVVPDQSVSDKAARPWLDRIYQPPVLTFSIKATNQKKQKLVFLVKDSRGKAFYQFKKNGKLPSQIIWDGVGDNGEHLHVGFAYTYSLSVVDEAGNLKRFAGKPFQLDSFQYVRSGKTVTAFTPELLFADRSSLKLSADGMDYLVDVKDYLRSRYGDKIDVVVYENDPRFGQSRAQVLKDFLMKSLDYPEDRITARSLPQSKGEGYRHADIVAK